MVHQALETSPFVLDGDPQFGLFLKAKRDLKAGELLHDDIPAFFGPSADLVEDYTTPLCLGCCVVMNDGNGSNRCPTCDWPICGPDCDNVSFRKSQPWGFDFRPVLSSKLTPVYFLIRLKSTRKTSAGCLQIIR